MAAGGLTWGQLIFASALLALCVPLTYMGIRQAVSGPEPAFAERFAVVDPGNLLRSSQPHIRDLERVRREHGLGAIAIVRSRPSNPFKRQWWDNELNWAAENGVRVIYLPCDADDPPTQDELDRFLALFNDPGNLPVLLHCEAGVHRTGIYSAIYGRAKLGWSLEYALENLDEHGFRTENHRRQKLVEVVRQYVPPHEMRVVQQ